MTNLKELTNVEITDELIGLNKEYKKVGDLIDMYENLIEEIEKKDKAFDNSTIANGEFHYLNKNKKSLDYVKETKHLNESLYKLYNESNAIWNKINEVMTFQRLGKAIMLYKAIKEC